MTKKVSINEVRQFWEENPLWTGESKFPIGSKNFFLEHHKVVIADCLAGTLDKRIFPDEAHLGKVLDLGCGPGFWTVELSLRGAKKIVAADLTENALRLAKKRCEIFGINAEFVLQNAEAMDFKDGSFSHVNCQGVIHHTPNTDRCITEIARVLEPDGTALISVYYKNFILRNWNWLSPLGNIIGRMGGGLSGRGREKIYSITDPDEIVRKFDGKDNPIGKSYTKKQFKKMLTSYFHVEEFFLHFFPARTLPIRVNGRLHLFLDRNMGFLLFARARRK